MPCCGRPNNRGVKGGEAEYYARHAYLTSAQKAKQAQLGVSNCASCDAITLGDPCKVCGNPKAQGEQKEG
jgi:hypothetical protein